MECSIALAGVKFTIEYDEVAIDVMKSQEIRHHNKTDYWIVGHNMLKYVDAYHIEHLVPLGREGTTANQSSEQGDVQVRVVGGRIQFYSVYPGRAVVLNISSNGSNSCSASIVYYKLQGHEFSELHGRRGKNLARGKLTLFADEHAENVTCTASETPD